MKIGIAQIATDPGDIKGNLAKILDNVERAKRSHLDLVIFPELAIPGYLLMDLAYSSDYISANLAALQAIAEASRGITTIVGFVDRDDNALRPGGRPKLYNSAAVLRDGAIQGIQDKSLLPNYGIFYEERYFEPARGQRIFEIAGEKIGIEICEDLWDIEYPNKVTQQLADMGASIVVNISASPFHIGHLHTRKALLNRAASENKITFVYVNLVGGFDGYEGEVVFDGRSMVYSSSGKLVCSGQPFTEDFLVFDTEVSCNQTFAEPAWEQECIDALQLGIKDYFRRSGLKRAYIGLSGGIDSSLVAYLSATALGAGNVAGVTMPSHFTSGETKSDAYRLAKNLGIEILERPIVGEYKAWLKDFVQVMGRQPANISKQNKQSRIRGSILMELSNEYPGAAVISTGNKTELAVGYCTLYGDMCGALAAIGDLSKTRVYQLCSYINASKKSEIIPNSIIERIPSAELEHNQTDRENLPCDYPTLSPLVEEIVESDRSFNELRGLFPEQLVRETSLLINRNEFKRRQAPPAIRVTKRAFGVGRRIPITQNFLPAADPTS
ncbi:MAG: NAD+ synthase [Deltaproteobacteria bacterium]|nr:NAD+ synthase [Deltaproteobacteria bacterium]